MCACVHVYVHKSMRGGEVCEFRTIFPTSKTSSSGRRAPSKVMPSILTTGCTSRSRGSMTGSSQSTDRDTFLPSTLRAMRCHLWGDRTGKQWDTKKAVPVNRTLVTYTSLSFLFQHWSGFTRMTEAWFGAKMLLEAEYFIQEKSRFHIGVFYGPIVSVPCAARTQTLLVSASERYKCLKVQCRG